MAVKRITDKRGRSVFIDEDTRKLYDYNNATKVITYNAAIVENGEQTGFYTDYIECGKVDDIEDRLEKWDNRIKLQYGMFIGFNASKNDKDRKIWNRLVDYVKENPDEFFDKYGDFKKDCIVDVERIIKNMPL